MAKPYIDTNLHIGNDRHHAPPVPHRRPPPRACVAGPIGRYEPSIPVAPLVGGVVLHFRPRKDNGARRRGGGGGIAAGAGCEDHVAIGGSATSGWNVAASTRRRWGVDGTDWRQERRGEVARDVGVESASAASFMHVTRPVSRSLTDSWA